MKGQLNQQIGPEWVHPWRWLSRLMLKAAGRKGIILALLLAIGGPAFAATSLQSSLELSDGRVFQSWSVMRQTDDSLTIKHAKGVAKIMKILLPPEVLAFYPIREEPAPVPPPLPPEPPGLDKTNQAERSISARDAISGIDVRWTGRIAAEENKGEITRTSKNRAGEFKADFALPFDFHEVPALEETVAKALKWSAAVAEKKPPRFGKSMGKVLGHEWTFSWDTDRVIIHTGMNEAPQLETQDLEKIQILLSVLPHLQKERRAEAEAGENFADSLK